MNEGETLFNKGLRKAGVKFTVDKYLQESKQIGDEPGQCAREGSLHDYITSLGHEGVTVYGRKAEGSHFIEVRQSARSITCSRW
jgi:hypothetical protein